MKILAIETSCECATVALMVDGGMRQYTLEGHANHSEFLLPAIGRLLAEAQLSLPQLDALAFGAGPGAFTGLRLACGVAQGLAMGVGLGVVPVCSLAALALQANAPNVFVATDARMGEAYSACFVLQNGIPQTFSPPACIPPQQLQLPPEKNWFIIGSALCAYADWQTRLPQDRIAGIKKEAHPQAADIARIAGHEVAAGRVLPPEQAAPLYVRNIVAMTTAERQAQKKHA